MMQMKSIIMSDYTIKYRELPNLKYPTMKEY